MSATDIGLATDVSHCNGSTQLICGDAPVRDRVALAPTSSPRAAAWARAWASAGAPSASQPVQETHTKIALLELAAAGLGSAFVSASMGGIGRRALSSVQFPVWSGACATYAAAIARSLSAFAVSLLMSGVGISPAPG